MNHINHSSDICPYPANPIEPEDHQPLAEILGIQVQKDCINHINHFNHKNHSSDSLY